MIRKTLAVGITLLFIVSVISPLVFGNNTELKHQKQVSELEEPPEVEWIKTYGGDYNDYAECVRQTNDGGYILVGQTRSYTSDGYEDALLMKTDENGDIEWYHTYGEPGPLNIDHGRSVQQTSDSGYVFTGTTFSYSENIKSWIVKTDENGVEEWNKTYYDGHSYSIQQTTDGGYIITGRTYISGFCRLLKTDSYGNEEWNRTFLEPNRAVGFSLRQTADGGYVLTGKIYLDDRSLENSILIKTDSNGIEEWNKTYGGPDFYVRSYSLDITNDGGYILIGDGGKDGGKVVWLIKTDADGNEQWIKTFGDPLFIYIVDEGQMTSDGGYIVGGKRKPYDGYDITDPFLMKIDSDGDLEWEFAPVESLLHDDGFYSVQQTEDGGYIGTGYYVSNYKDVLLVKIGPEYEIKIIKPENALYVTNNKIRNYLIRNPMIFGPIDIEVDVYNENITTVEFYIDDYLMETDISKPFIWTWDTWAFFRHTIEVIGYNESDIIGNNKKTLWKFL